MRRLYFLVPDVATTKKIVDELLLARIDERHIHVLAKRDTPLEDLPEATFLQKTDFVPAMEQGLAVGGATGLLAGLTAVAVPGGLVLGGGALLGMSLLGAGLGAWWSSMIGAGIGNRRLKDYEEAIERGEILVMADVPRERVPAVEGRIKQHHPEVQFGGLDPTVPPFP
jgi:hypothetical protein